MFHDFPTYKLSFQVGWWLTYPSEKWWSSSMGFGWHPIYEMENHPNVPSHQPGYIVIVINHIYGSFSIAMLNNQRVFLVIDSPVMVDFPFPKWPKLRASRSAWRCESAAAAPHSRRRRQWRWSRRKPLQIRWDLVQLWQLISCNLLFLIPQKKEKPNSPLNWWRFMFRSFLGVTITGWWLTYPSEKYESQLGWLFPIYGKTKIMFHTTNHY